MINDLRAALLEMVLADIKRYDPNAQINEWSDKVIDFSESRFDVVSFDYEKLDPLLSPRIIAKSTFINKSDGTASEGFTDSKSTAANASWTITKGISESISINAGFPLFGSVNASMNINTSEQRQQGQTITQNWSWNTLISIPKRARIEASVFIQEAIYSPKFTAKLVLVGPIIMRYKHLGKAGSIVSAPGKILIDEFKAKYDWLSHPLGSLWPKYTSWDLAIEISGDFEGVAGINYVIKTEQFPLDDIQTPGIKSNNLQNPQRWHTIFLGGEPGLGPADGISYQILGTREDRRPSALCGYNDVGAPKTAIYQIETRLYTDYINGTLLRTWQEDLETFLSCEEI